MALQQIRDAVDEAETITIKHDGTTKLGQSLLEVELETENGTYLAEVHPTVGGTAQEIADTITDILSAIDSVSTASATNDTDTSSPSQTNTENTNTLPPTMTHTASWMLKIRKSMSDRCITNQDLERILEAKSGHKLNNFKCAVHPLDAMARS